MIAATADHIISLDVLPPRDPPRIEDNDPSAESSCDPLADLCDAVDRVDLPDATLSGIRQGLRTCATDLLDPEGAGSSLSGDDVCSGFGR